MRLILLIFLVAIILSTRSTAQDFDVLLRSESPDTASLNRFYSTTNNSIQQYLDQESYSEALNLVEKGIIVSRKFDYYERLRAYYLKASLINFRLGDTSKSLAYLRMFELEVESNTSERFSNERSIYFNELTRLYQRIEQDSVLNRSLLEQRALATEREDRIVLWIKIILSVLAVSAALSIYFFIENQKLKSALLLQETENRFDSSTLESSSARRSSQPIDVSREEKLDQYYFITESMIQSSLKQFSDADLETLFPSSYFFEELNKGTRAVHFVKNPDKNVTIIGFFASEHESTFDQLGLLQLLKCTDKVFESDVSSPGMILTLLDQQLTQNLSSASEQIESATPIFAGILCINSNTRSIQYSGAGIPLVVMNQTDTYHLSGQSAPLGSSVFKNPVYQTQEGTVKKGEWLYLFSPGFINQIGGSQNTTLGSNSFSNLLQKIFSESADDQMFMIRKFFREWKGTNEQTGTSSILGIKI